MPTPLQGGSYINIGNDAFGPVRFRVVLNIKKFDKNIIKHARKITYTLGMTYNMCHNIFWFLCQSK